MFAVFLEATATVESLPRPLIVAIIGAGVVQVVLSLVFRSRYVGAYGTLCVALAMLDWPVLGTILAAVPVSVTLAAWIFRRAHPSIPWPRMTEFLNVLGVVLLVLSVGTTWNSGALMPMDHPASVATSASGPDIYLVLLDGHPRGDTMRDEFGLDSDRLLEPLEQLGFEVADLAHSNYNFTALTLASMFDMQQIGSIDGLDPHQSPAVQHRELARTINSGAALGQLRNLGYEIVTVPSPAGVVTLHSADRVVADGSITQFEFSLLELGINPLLAPDVQRTLVMGSLRGRVLRSLEQTVELAKERGGRPKLVFTHVMSPHAPVLFAADGTAVDGWPCYPKCSAFDFGWRYGDEALGPLGDQIEYIDARVVETVRRILEASPNPPIIILFSDHGSRYHLNDRAEMLRSLLVTFTPGRNGVFPSDASPVNLFPRLLNAYFGAKLALTSEESYTVELMDLITKGPLSLQASLSSR